MGAKKIWVKKFWVKNFWVLKIFGIKKMFDPKFFSFEKKTGRVNPRWRIYDPPPRK